MLAATTARCRREGGPLCVYVCVIVLEHEGLGGHLVVLAAGGKKVKFVGGGNSTFIKTPLCEADATPHPGCLQ